MSLAQRERASLKNLLLEVGPDAPTCCEGWKTRDLAIHLLLRETRPDAALGMFVPKLSGHLENVTDKFETVPYEEIVNRWGSGPSIFFKPIDRYANAAEYFIHHEDVRRARSFERRELSSASDSELYRSLKVANRMLAKSKARILLRPEGEISYEVIEAGDQTSPRTLVVTGPVPEILLWVYDRPAVDLDFFGDPAVAVKKSL